MNEDERERWVVAWRVARIVDDTIYQCDWPGPPDLHGLPLIEQANHCLYARGEPDPLIRQRLARGLPF